VIAPSGVCWHVHTLGGTSGQVHAGAAHCVGLTQLPTLFALIRQISAPRTHPVPTPAQANVFLSVEQASPLVSTSALPFAAVHAPSTVVPVQAQTPVVFGTVWLQVTPMDVQTPSLPFRPQSPDS
jgi:hypothetical protein